MGFSEAIKTCLVEKYCCFEGRASRSEYWWFYLFSCLVSWGVSAATLPLALQGTNVQWITWIVSIVFFLPSLGAMARRLHDTGRSAWWILILFTCIGVIPMLIFLCSDSDHYDNQYGPDPTMQEF